MGVLVPSVDGFSLLSEPMTGFELRYYPIQNWNDSMLKRRVFFSEDSSD